MHRQRKLVGSHLRLTDRDFREMRAVLGIEEEPEPESESEQDGTFAVVVAGGFIAGILAVGCLTRLLR